MEELKSLIPLEEDYNDMIDSIKDLIINTSDVEEMYVIDAIQVLINRTTNKFILYKDCEDIFYSIKNDLEESNMNKEYKDLTDLNRVLNLNYDKVLNDDLIEYTRVSMLMLANHIEEMWDVYKKEGYYIDTKAFDLLNETYGDLLQLSNKLRQSI